MIQVRFSLCRSLTLVCAASAFVFLPGALAQEKPDPAGIEPSIWMRKKLDYSREILGALASGDFQKMTENAQAMQAMSTFEGFLRRRMPGYRSQLQIFQDANDQLIKHAQNDNIEGATLAFTQLTVSCVTCHKQLREGVPKTKPAAK